MSDGTWLWLIRIRLDYALGKSVDIHVELQEEPVLWLVKRARDVWYGEDEGGR